jgi:hypothetical protein
MNAALTALAPTLIRHGIAALGGALACDASSLTSLLSGVLVMLVSVMWSYFAHTKGDRLNEHSPLLAELSRALASNAVAALSGVLATHGFTGQPDDTAAVLLFLGNATHSSAVKTLRTDDASTGKEGAAHEGDH